MNDNNKKMTSIERVMSKSAGLKRGLSTRRP